MATGNKGFYEVNLQTVDKDQAVDTQVQVRFFVISAPTTDVLKKTGLAFPPPVKFALPAFPQASNLVGQVTAPRFRMYTSNVFTLADGQTLTPDIVLFRTPSKWKADFAPWAAVPAELNKLKRGLERSPNLKVIGGQTYPLFTAGAYDGVTTNRDILAKACLLNLYQKLSMTIEPVGREKPWFSFVRQILEIGQERCLAIVEPEMGQLVRKIKDKIGDFEEYKNTPAGNHHGNIPAGYRVVKSEMFSVKTKEKLGNLQLTMSPAIAPDGSSVLLLDADIDENGELMKHLADLFRHKFSGGTHPFDIHEYLALAYPRKAIGYSLV